MNKHVDLFPYGIYDQKHCQMLYIGLHRDPQDCWGIYLGWPSHNEIKWAQDHGKVCLRLTMNYDPDRPATH